MVAFSLTLQKPSTDWYKSYFDNIQEKNIKSYKLISIIDHNLEETQTRGLGMEEFFQTLQQRVHATKECDYQVEIFYTDEISDHTMNLLTQWSEQYESILKITPLKSIVDQVGKDGFSPALCVDPHAHYCKNLIKLWSMDQDKDLTVYLDPLLWERHYQAKKTLLSQFAFGNNACSIFHSLITYPNLDDLDSKDLFYISNDMMINHRKSLSYTQLKNLVLRKIHQSYAALDYIAQRPILFKNIEWNDYTDIFAQRTLWWLEHPFIELNENVLLSSTVGNGLLTEATLRHIISLQRTLPVQHNPEEALVLKGSMNFDLLKRLMNEDQAKETLAFILSYQDYKNCIPDNRTFYTLLKEEIKHKWLTLNSIQQKYSKTALNLKEPVEL
jgi:hypothetical protein